MVGEVSLRRKASVGTGLIIMCLLFGACTSDGANGDQARPRGDDSVIVIGAYDFTESSILAHLYARALRGGGYPVELLEQGAPREIMEPALEQSFVDLVPEYQGTALTFLSLGRETAPTQPEETHRLLAEAFGARAIAVLDFAPAENKNEVVVTKPTADRYQLETISDLQRVASGFVFGGPPECPDRPLCLLGLEETYKLEFEAFQPLDAGGPLTVAALEGGEIDAGILFTTNPEISEKALVVLRDDLGLQPSENVVPVVRQEILDAYGSELARLLDSVTARLSSAALRDLNERVELRGDDPAEVAAEWLEQEGLGN